VDTIFGLTLVFITCDRLHLGVTRELTLDASQVFGAVAGELKL
jgi:hypothetical protein